MGLLVTLVLAIVIHVAHTPGRTMNYTIDIISIPMPQDDASAWKRHSEFRRLYFDDDRPPAPALRELHNIVTARYRCLSSYAHDDPSIDECVWSDGPLINNFCGDMAALGIQTGAGMEQVHAFIIARAQALQLTVFDPQTRRVFRPSPPSAEGVYSIAIDGVLDGFALDEVVPALARMVKRSEEQIRILLAAPGTVVKSGIDETTAGKYQTALTKIGCRCVISHSPASMSINEVPESQAQRMARLHAAASGGNAEAQFELGRAYACAKDVLDHERLAAEWIEKAAEQGHDQAAYAIACLYHVGDGVLKNYAAALFWAKVAAEKGIVDAQYMLSVMYAEGQGTRPDPAQAHQWLIKASELGHARAQYRRGHQCRSDGDPAMAAFWFQKAADQGDLDAVCSLGVMYAQGYGVARDVVRAMTYHVQAAGGGVPQAQYNLAEAFANGDGIAADDAQAVTWYSKAAAQGHPKSQYQMAMRYRFGAGVEKNIRESIQWLQRAAENGEVEAQFFLGGLYSEGDGVPADRNQSLYWLQQAARQGHAQALEIIRLMGGR